jgi:hypothetical protein
VAPSALYEKEGRHGIHGELVRTMSVERLFNETHAARLALREKQMQQN